MDSKSAPPKKLLALRKGKRGEWLAAMALRLKGYKIVARGFRTKTGEIDIIARKRDLIVIVEVKARKSVAGAIDAVSYTSQQRISSAADIWVSRQPDFARLSIRFDIIAIVPGKWPRHFADAF